MAWPRLKQLGVLALQMLFLVFAVVGYTAGYLTHPFLLVLVYTVFVILIPLGISNWPTSTSANLSEMAGLPEEPPEDVLVRQQAALNDIIDKCRHASPTQEIGASVISYEINCGTSKATIRFEDKYKTNARFFKFGASEVIRVRDYYLYTNKANHKNIMRPRLMISKEEPQAWILFYEEFDCEFEHWDIERHIPFKYQVSWWVKSIKGILKAINHMHNRGLAHTGLDDPSNYVIQGGLKLIHIGGALDPRDPRKSRAMKTQDFKAFKEFLQNRLPQTLEDRDIFLDYINNIARDPDRCFKKLIKHPLLRSHHRNLKCFFEIDQALTNNTAENPARFYNELSRKQCFSQYRGWTDKPMKNVLALVYACNVKSYSGEDLISLIKFLRHVYVHHNDYNSDQSVEVIANDVSELFRGFLSHLHEIFNFKDKRYIT